MKQVAKIILIDPDNLYLLLWRDKHPRFGNDMDLPGGTIEADETATDALIREVQEEIGLTLSAQPRLLYSGDQYSRVGTHYSLFVTRLTSRPQLQLSWEHSRHEWVKRPAFLETAHQAADTYMHMVYDVLTKDKSLA